MIGLVVVTHGRLAHEFVAAMEHVVGPQDHVRSISIGPDDDMEQRRTDIADAINATSCDKGVLVLTDMFGGTPSNLALSLMEKGKVDVLAGINLPMLIKIIEARGTASLEEITQLALQAGRRYMAIGSDIMDPS